MAGNPKAEKTACTALAARRRSPSSSSSPTGSIPPSTCQSRCTVSHSSRSFAS
jgi:hypothetical protein